MLPRLHVILDAEAARQGIGDPVEIAAECADAGARLFQLRAKGLDSADLFELGQRVSEVLVGYRATLLINDRADIARVVDADGVHLPSRSMPIHAVRRLIDQDLIGCSCHDVDDVRRAAGDGANLVTLSPIWESGSKPGRPGLGLSTLTAACEAVEIPVYALSGVTPDRVHDCLDAGAHGIAVMSGIVAHAEPGRATERYLAALGSN